MSEIKFLEIRDRATFIPAMAVKLIPKSEKEIFLTHAAGFAPFEHYVLLHPLNTYSMCYDAYDWKTGARTFPIAHKHIIEYWDTIKSGDVIDVEFILGEKTFVIESVAVKKD